jgi:modulator of FtsH protease
MSATLSYQGTEATNKVFRNTFILLATTLIPTVLGTFLALSLGLPAAMASSPWLFFLGFLGVSFVMFMAIHATARSFAAIPLLWAFAGLMGAVLSGVVSVALKRADGAQLVALAAIGTAAVMVGCSLYAMTTKRDFSSMGGFLFGSLLAVIAVSLLNVAVFQLPILATVIACVTLVLFSAYMIYDVQQIVNGGETNYVLATVGVYLNMVNIFSSLLQIFMAGDDD